MGIIARKKAILLNTPHLETVSGVIASFGTDMKVPMKSLKAHFSPIQEGSGDPSPTNVRNISGWNGITVKQCGKNLFNISTLTHGKYINNNGDLVNTPSGYDWSYTDYMPVIGGQTLIFYSTGASGNDPRCAWYDKNKILLSTFKKEATYNSNTIKQISIPQDACFVRFSILYTASNIVENCLSSAFVCVNGIVGEYESYKGIDIPISWESESGTLYGGYVDLVSGELVVDTALITFDGSSDEQWNVENLLSGKSFYMWKTNINPTPSPTSQYSADSDRYPSKAKCNQARIQNYGELYSSGLFFFSERALNMHLGTTLGISTVADFKTYLSSHNLQVAYELATKITYQLTPQQIKSFIGHNNIWSDAGDVEVQYWKH